MTVVLRNQQSHQDRNNSHNASPRETPLLPPRSLPLQVALLIRFHPSPRLLQALVESLGPVLAMRKPGDKFINLVLLRLEVPEPIQCATNTLLQLLNINPKLLFGSLTLLGKRLHLPHRIPKHLGLLENRVVRIVQLPRPTHAHFLHPLQCRPQLCLPLLVLGFLVRDLLGFDTPSFSLRLRLRKVPFLLLFFLLLRSRTTSATTVWTPSIAPQEVLEGHGRLELDG